jgi:hypothetical protein
MWPRAWGQYRYEQLAELRWMTFVLLWALNEPCVKASKSTETMTVSSNAFFIKTPYPAAWTLANSSTSLSSGETLPPPNTTAPASEPPSSHLSSRFSWYHHNLLSSARPYLDERTCRDREGFSESDAGKRLNMPSLDQIKLSWLYMHIQLITFKGRKW